MAFTLTIIDDTPSSETVLYLNYKPEEAGGWMAEGFSLLDSTSSNENFKHLLKEFQIGEFYTLNPSKSTIWGYIELREAIIIKE